MRTDQRVVTQLPLTELWNAQEILPLERKRVVGLKQVTALLRSGRVSFVLAGCGEPLRWIPTEDCYRYWKEDLKQHLVEPDAAEKGFRPEDWPGQYCFVATEWGEIDGETVVLLEVHH